MSTRLEPSVAVSATRCASPPLSVRSDRSSDKISDADVDQVRQPPPHVLHHRPRDLLLPLRPTAQLAQKTPARREFPAGTPRRNSSRPRARPAPRAAAAPRRTRGTGSTTASGSRTPAGASCTSAAPARRRNRAARRSPAPARPPRQSAARSSVNSANGTSTAQIVIVRQREQLLQLMRIRRRVPRRDRPFAERLARIGHHARPCRSPRCCRTPRTPDTPPAAD